MYLSTLHIMGNDLGQPDKASVLSPSCLIYLGIDFHEHITFKLGGGKKSSHSLRSMVAWEERDIQIPTECETW